MIKKLRLRYLITNMALLSGTMLIFLGVLFGFLYHSEVNASYKVMQKMLDEANLQSQPRDTPSPTGRTTQTEPELVPLSEPGVLLLGEGQSGSTPWYSQWGQQNQDQNSDQQQNQRPGERAGGKGDPCPQPGKMIVEFHLVAPRGQIKTDQASTHAADLRIRKLPPVHGDRPAFVPGDRGAQ